MSKESKRIKDIVKPFGLEYRHDKRHSGVYRISDNKRLIVCSGSASDPMWWRQVIRDLIKYGHIPKAKYW